jgi:CubicO group peptidase (beta-lactamase class C family)
MKKSWFLKVLFLLTISCVLGLFAFNRAEAPSKDLSVGSMLSADSILSIRKSIHADEKAQMLDTLFLNRVKRTGFNGCVLVAQRGQIIYEKAFGLSVIKTKDSLRINSPFQLASASKTLTAAAILLLKDQEKLKLDDDVQKYLPEFPYAGISLKMLLSHRSGLFNYIYACEPFCDRPNKYKEGNFDNAAMLKIIAEQKPAVYSLPDKKFEYSNTNYALLALIVERISGKTFGSFMKEEIFDKLGMKDTWIWDPQNAPANCTRGHMSNGKEEIEVYADNVVGDKGVYSTVEDMLKWDQALYTEQLLKKATIAEAFTGYSHEHKGKRNYGLGWRLVDDGKSPKIIYHNGWWHGYNSLFFRRPADQTTIIMLSNKYNRSTYQVQDILAILNVNGASVDMEGEE